MVDDILRNVCRTSRTEPGIKCPGLVVNKKWIQPPCLGSSATLVMHGQLPRKEEVKTMVKCRCTCTAEEPSQQCLSLSD
ncbi:hypothetical protein F2Q68_00040898 [Brassica cretica]|uniref:Uncharacterized protein n=1 Tax=Brassica cretica TaxID=69181 RepID=A0A8S9MHJ4_BRACR|nr:hypothetical protein F2Q68_00040898 [Brassica cretica]